MSSSLYMLFDTSKEGESSLASRLKGVDIPGYSFWGTPLKDMICAPGEPEMPVRWSFYAQSYFRIHVSDLAIEFYREAVPRPDLVAAENLLRNHIFKMSQFRLRRWVATSEGWDDNDDQFVLVLSGGTDFETLTAELAATLNCDMQD